MEITMSELEIIAQHLDGATTAAAWAVGAYVIAKWIFHTAIVVGALLTVIWWILKFIEDQLERERKHRTSGEEK